MCRGSGPTCSGKMKTCEAGKDACVAIVGESSTSMSPSVKPGGGGCEGRDRQGGGGTGEGKTIPRWMEEREYSGVIETIAVRDFRK